MNLCLFPWVLLSRSSYLVIRSCPLHLINLLNQPGLFISMASALLKVVDFSHLLYYHCTFLSQSTSTLELTPAITAKVLLAECKSDRIALRLSRLILLRLSLSTLRAFPAPCLTACQNPNSVTWPTKCWMFLLLHINFVSSYSSFSVHFSLFKNCGIKISKHFLLLLWMVFPPPGSPSPPAPLESPPFSYSPWHFQT